MKKYSQSTLTCSIDIPFGLILASHLKQEKRLVDKGLILEQRLSISKKTEALASRDTGYDVNYGESMEGIGNGYDYS